MAKRRRSSRKSSKTSDAIAGCLVLVIAVVAVVYALINGFPGASSSSTPRPTTVRSVSTVRPTITPLPIRTATPRPTTVPRSNSAPQVVCPSNCTDARARGLTAQQAAACGLDRDGDGVACYGD